MLANAAAIQAAATGYNVLFERGRTGVSTYYTDFSQTVPSTGYAENYQLAPLGVTIEEWKGDRQIKGVKLFDLTITNTDYEGTFAVPRNAFEDDNLGQFNSMAAELGIEAARHPDILAAALLAGGFASTDTLYGTAFFSNSQPTKDGSNDRDNLMTGALSAATFNSAFELLESMKGYNGQPLNVMGLGKGVDLIVSPASRSLAEGILVAQLGTGGISNTNYGKARLVVNPYLTGAGWYLAVRGAPRGALIHQTRREHRLQSITNPESEDFFYKKRVVYGTDGRYAMGYGCPEMIVGSAG